MQTFRKDQKFSTNISRFTSVGSKRANLFGRQQDILTFVIQK